MLSTTYDAQADALCIGIRKGTVARTRPLDDWTMVDEDAAGTALGIEVLHPAREWPLHSFLAIYEVGGMSQQLLEEMFPPASTGRSTPFRAKQVDLNAAPDAEACLA